MGYFYSLGVNFNERELAEKCNQKVKNFEIKLTDDSIVEVNTYVYEEKLIDGKFRYQSQIFPEGMQCSTGNRKLLSKPYFYEIRNKLYSFLYELDMEFNYAFYEFAGADCFLDEDVVEQINKFGIGTTEKDKNASFMGFFNVDYYLPKRHLDGLILSERMFSNIEDKNSFEEFKNKYMWLPFDYK